MNFLTAKWENLIMANYAVPPELLKPFLPKGTELDYYEGKTYVSLVGFLFSGIKIFNISALWLDTFEEINLRFYVIRRQGDTVKRGVVFINETVPYKAVAWLANKLYKEHYTAIPTRRYEELTPSSKQIEYYWKTSQCWNHIKVKASSVTEPMPLHGIEEFIFEHYYGYTRVSETASIEYAIAHQRWLVHAVKDFSVECDFKAMYGEGFSFLSEIEPDTIFMAEGSGVSVNWKRIPF